MSLDALAEQEAILARASTLLGGRVYDGIPDEERLTRTDGVLDPYAVVWFGELFPSNPADHSLTGEEDQPATMSVLFDIWSESATTSRQAISAFHPLFIGWSANDNMSPMVLRGSGSFAFHQTTTGPTRFSRTLTLQFTINNSVELSA